MIYYQCPSCQAVHSSVELLAGLTVFCKQCRHPIEVPKTSTVEAPVVESPSLPPIFAAPRRQEPQSNAAGATHAPIQQPAPTPTTPSQRKPMMRWLVLVLFVVLTPLAYLAWRFFAS